MPDHESCSELYRKEPRFTVPEHNTVEFTNSSSTYYNNKPEYLSGYQSHCVAVNFNKRFVQTSQADELTIDLALNIHRQLANLPSRLEVYMFAQSSPLILKNSITAINKIIINKAGHYAIAVQQTKILRQPAPYSNCANEDDE